MSFAMSTICPPVFFAGSHILSSSTRERSFPLVRSVANRSMSEMLEFKSGCSVKVLGIDKQVGAVFDSVVIELGVHVTTIRNHDARIAPHRLWHGRVHHAGCYKFAKTLPGYALDDALQKQIIRLVILEACPGWSDDLP